MRRAGSLLMDVAHETAVPAGHALAVDRDVFAAKVTEAIEREPLIHIHREEVTSIDEENDLTVIATGPLTSDALAAEIQRLTRSATSSANGGEAPAKPTQLYFYDSISPIVEADSIDMSTRVHGGALRQGHSRLHQLPDDGRRVQPLHRRAAGGADGRRTRVGEANYFEGCLPIEEIARRGRDTLRFGPMKPVGLRDPKTGYPPYAVVQLRQENLRADSYNLVGFQNHLKFGEQARILRLIPGLENAKFLRYGQIHRNTYINAPTLLDRNTADEAAPARPLRRTDLRRGRLRRIDRHRTARRTHAASIAAGAEPVAPPRATAFGALVNYICHAEAKHFQPANITFDLLEQLDEGTKRRVRDKKERHRLVCERALAEFDCVDGRSEGDAPGEMTVRLLLLKLLRTKPPHAFVTNYIGRVIRLIVSDVV